MNNGNLNNNEGNNTINSTGGTPVSNLNNIEVLGDDLATQNQPNQIDYNSFIKPVEQPKQDPNELLNAVPNPNMMISSPTTNMITSDDLIEDFVGKNYEKISKRKYNLSAFFFNVFYLLYRKLYLEGIVLFFVLIFSSLFLSIINPGIALLLEVLISLILCFLFNKYYLGKAKKKIDKIKSKNKSKSITDLKNVCKKAGGTNIVLSILISVLLTIVASVVIMTLFAAVIYTIISKLGLNFNQNNNSSNINENINKDNDSNDNSDNLATNKYNGSLSYNENINLGEKLNMGYLLIFKSGSLNSNYLYDYSYQTDTTNEGSTCSFTLGNVKDYNDSKKLIKEIADYNNVSNDVSNSVTSKNLSINSVIVNHDLKNVYYSAFNDANNNVYLLTYEISSTANENICKAFYNGIINSIELQ